MRTFDPMQVASDAGHDFIIYPQSMTSAMQATRDQFVAGYFPDKAQWLSSRIKRRSAEAQLVVAPDAAVAQSLSAQFGQLSAA